MGLLGPSQAGLLTDKLLTRMKRVDWKPPTRRNRADKQEEILTGDSGSKFSLSAVKGVSWVSPPEETTVFLLPLLRNYLD